MSGLKGRLPESIPGALVAPALAALLVAIGRMLNWQGVDYPAQVYRVNGVKAHGIGIWDFQWYGGHWTFDYSVIFPAVASALGVGVVVVGSAAAASLAFDRLAVPALGPGGRVASYIFAAGTVVPAAIGQLPFLGGEALGLCAFWAATRGRWLAAGGLALTTSLCSPLAGAFVALGMAAWGWSVLRTGGWRPWSRRPWSRRAWGGRTLGRSRGRGRLVPATAALVLVAMVPVGASAILFPGVGAMPYPFVDFVWEVIVALIVLVAAGRTQPAIRWGCVLFVLAASFAEAVPNALGGNVGRIEDALALPLAVGLLWRRWQLLLPFVAIPLTLSQWVPAWGAITSDASQPSTHVSYFSPLLVALKRFSTGTPAGRVEVVPTEFHWESAYVAPVMPMARGWERQLDVADNPLFYRPGDLTAATYRQWLVNNGVRFVAVADAPLDMAGVAEGRLVASNSVPGLHLIWRSAHWRLYSVLGSGGIVPAPARLVSAEGDQVVVDTPVAGQVLIRVRYSPDWTVSVGDGCVSKSTGSWILFDAFQPEQFSLRLSLFGQRPPYCPAHSVTVAAGGRAGARG